MTSARTLPRRGGGVVPRLRRPPRTDSRLRTLVASYRVLPLLIVRDLKVRYAGSLLGYLWTILDPLLMALIYFFVFTKIFHRDAGPASRPYIVFLVSGLLLWNWAYAVIFDATKSLTAEAKMVRSTSVPREIWVIRTVGSKFVEFLLSLPVLALFVVVYSGRVSVSPDVAFAPLALLIQFTFLTGAALIIAPLTVLFRDVERMVRILLRMLFYFSPVLYGVQNVSTDPHVRTLFGLNPLSGPIDLFRASLFPRHFGGWHTVAVSGTVSVVFLLVGMWTFRRLEGIVLKEI